MAIAPILISTVSLLLSLTVAWLTLFRRGNLGMTQPVLIGFLYEGEQPKVFLRTMLYATGKRGHIIEGLYLKVRRGGSTQTFNFWMYGETKPEMIGSGLRVGEDGASFNHYFLPPTDAAAFSYISAEYVIDVYARVLNQSTPVLLYTVKLSLSQELAAALRDPTKDVRFIWGPDSQCYHGHVSQGPIPYPLRGRPQNAEAAGGRTP